MVINFRVLVVVQNNTFLNFYGNNEVLGKFECQFTMKIEHNVLLSSV